MSGGFFAGVGKFLIVAGALIAVIGIIFLLIGKIPSLEKFFFPGRLPGDIIIRKKNFTLYFPLATSILISIIITLILWLAGRR